MIDLENLLSNRQHTLLCSTGWVKGTTLRGIPAHVRFNPTPENSGRSLTVRVGDNRQPLFTIHRIGLANGRVGHSWTDVVSHDPRKPYGVGVIEHPAAAIILAGLDNVEIEVRYPQRIAAGIFYAGGWRSSMPLMDGTARHYLNAIRAASVTTQNRPRKWLTVKQRYEFRTNGSNFILAPRVVPGWSVSARNNFPREKETWWWREQEPFMTYDLDTDIDIGVAEKLPRIATARPTNRSLRDWLAFRLLTLGSGRKPDFTVLHGPWGYSPVGEGVTPYAPDEAIRHRHLDLLGDLFFFGGYWNVNLTVENGSHAATHAFRQHLLANPDILVPAA